MKTVFTTQMIAHVWAQQSQYEGRNGSESTKNHWFRGTALYSYATPIANFVTNKKGNKAVLITTRSYSVTTNVKHMPSRYDIPPGIPVFRVLHIGATGGRALYPATPESKGGFHRDNFNDMAERYIDELKAMARGNIYRREGVISGVPALRDQAMEYCKFFGIRFAPSRFPLPTKELLDKYVAEAKAASIAKAKETKQREEKKRIDAQETLDAYLASSDISIIWHWKNNATPEQIAIYTAEHAAREAKAVELMTLAAKAFIAGHGELPAEWARYISDRELLAAIYAEDTKRWRAGSKNSILPLYMDKTLMRIYGDKVQTSRGAEFPVKHAKLAWPVVKECRENKKTWHTNGHKIPVGVFNIDSIDESGNVRAGCHFVEFEEVQQVAQQLGIA